MRFKRCNRKTSSFKEEVSSTAKYIFQRADKPLFLCYSGGIDSEVIATTFLECNIPFTAISFRYPNNINYYDIEYAVKFCQNHKVNHQIVEFDPVDLYSKQLSEGGKLLHVWYNHLQVEMLKYIDSIGGCAVLGLGVCDHPLYTVDNQICYKMSPGFLLSEEWCKKSNTVHFPYFFLSTPEIYASYISDPLMTHLLSEPNYFKNRNRTQLNEDSSMQEFSYPIIEKFLMFYKFWPDMERRPKYDGFEKLRSDFLEIEKKYKDINFIPKVLLKNVSEIKAELGLI